MTFTLTASRLNICTEVDKCKDKHIGMCKNGLHRFPFLKFQVLFSDCAFVERCTVMDCKVKHYLNSVFGAVTFEEKVVLFRLLSPLT